MTSPIKLVTKRDEAADTVAEKLDELRVRVAEEPYVGLACVLIRHDGTVFVTQIGNGNRCLLLGAITDLQYTLAKAGDD